MSLDLSVVIITRDEAADLPACLDSVRGLASEIVVVDNHSTDGTVELARSKGALVRTRAFDDFASQKQWALEQATRGWILSIDADERVSPELARQLERILPSAPAPRADAEAARGTAREESGSPAPRADAEAARGTAREEPPAPAVDGFDIPFSIEFMGRRLRFGGLGSEHHLRLVRRGAGRFVGGGLHEGIEVEGPVGRLGGRIVHLPYRDLDEYFAKLGRYTTLAAQKRFEAGRRTWALHHLQPFWELFARLVLRGGVLDGAPGVVYAGLSAFHTWIKYVKLMELQEGRRP